MKNSKLIGVVLCAAGLVLAPMSYGAVITDTTALTATIGALNSIVVDESASFTVTDATSSVVGSLADLAYTVEITENSNVDGFTLTVSSLNASKLIIGSSEIPYQIACDADSATVINDFANADIAATTIATTDTGTTSILDTATPDSGTLNCTLSGNLPDTGLAHNVAGNHTDTLTWVMTPD